MTAADADDHPGPDPHMLAALRHAPDRGVAPPAALDRAILEAAHAALRLTPVPAAMPASAGPGPGTALPSNAGTSGSGAARRWWRATLEALTRPAGAAAFASLVLATLIGVMWQDGPPPATGPADAGSAPLAMPPSLAPMPASQPQGDAPPSIDLTRAPAPAAKTATAPTTPKRPAPARAPAAESGVAPATAPTWPAATPPPAAIPSAGARIELSGTAVPAEPSAAGTSAERSAPAVAAAPAAAAPAPGTAAPRTDPLRQALATMDAGNADAAALQLVQQAGAGRWQAIASAPRPTTTPRRWNGPDGQVSGSLWLEDTSLYWQDAAGAWWRAPLSGDEATALRQRLWPGG